ncbi:MAG: hypothetical protein WCC14_09245 [Acidobacteriaceae bacterium]
MSRKPILILICLAAALAAPAQETAPQPGKATAAEATKHSASKRDRRKAQQLFLEGAKDLNRDQPRAAMEAFARAATLDPDNRRYAASENVARQRLVADLIQRADKAKVLGHLDEAQAAIREAFQVDPEDPVVAQHVDELAENAAASEPAPPSPAADVAPPVKLEPKAGVHDFHVYLSERQLIEQVMQAYGIQATIDDSVPDGMIRYNVDGIDFAGAKQTLELATNTFIVPLDPVRALVARDTRANRMKFEREGTETFYLRDFTNEELTSMVSMARDVFSLKSATADIGQDAITVRGPVEDLDALNATLDSLRGGKSEIQLDVSMYEVDRTKATNVGAIIPTQTTLFNVYSEATSLLQNNASLVQEIISSGLAAPGDWEAILAILVASGQVSNSILTQPFGVFGGGLTMTGITYAGGSVNMQLNSTDVHSVDQTQLRVLDQQEGTLKAGERYPIMVSNYTGTGTGLSIPGISSAGISSTLQNLGVNISQLESAAEQTIPQIQYQDIGLTLTVTPHVEGPRGMSLKFDLKLSSLEGSSLNGLPVINNREYQAITSLKAGESTVLVSALSRQESDAITGIPGLSDLPGFQDGTNKNSSLDYSELAIVITPHIIRSVRPESADRMILVPPAQ